MSDEWHKIVSCTGVSKPGVVGFNVNFVVPDVLDETIATERQLEAVKIFYGREFPNLRKQQAHRLLSFREYARLCSAIFFKNYDDRLQVGLSTCLAAYITHYPEMGDFVANWSTRNFEKGIDSPRVRGTPYFLDMQNFSDFLVKQLSESRVFPIRPKRHAL